MQPLKPEYQSRLERKFMLEFNYNSNHIEGNTLTYGQTEMLLMFGKVVDEANMKDLEEMKAHNVCLKMMQTEAGEKDKPLTETFIRQLHNTLLREDYTVYRQQPDGSTTSYVVHAGVYKTRPNSVITVTGERFEYASPEETPALMNDLVGWYNDEARRGVMSPIELASVFHYRYIRIHPFEDGNGRIARLLVNYILTRHGYPMIVVKSKDKENYLTALNRCDVAIGPTPSDGAHAGLEQLAPFVGYMSKCVERALIVGIRAAHGENIEEEDDFAKELKLLTQKIDYKKNENAKKIYFCEDEFWNVLEYVFFPLTEKLGYIIKQVADTISFSYFKKGNYLSRTGTYNGGMHVNEVLRGMDNHILRSYVNNAKTMWFHFKLSNPNEKILSGLIIEDTLHITFYKEYYEIEGNKYLYGQYPNKAMVDNIISTYKEKILSQINNLLR